MFLSYCTPLSLYPTTEGGLSWLSQTFNLCQPLKDASELSDWLESTWFNIAMGKSRPVCQPKVSVVNSCGLP